MPTVTLDIDRPRGYPDLLAVYATIGKAYLDATLGPSDSLADWADSGMPTLASYLRGMPIHWTGYIEDLQVPKQLRGHGLGSVLLARVLTYMRQIGIQEVFLQPVAEIGYAGSLWRLYERFGFAECRLAGWHMLVKKLT